MYTRIFWTATRKETLIHKKDVLRRSASYNVFKVSKRATVCRNRKRMKYVSLQNYTKSKLIIIRKINSANMKFTVVDRFKLIYTQCYHCLCFSEEWQLSPGNSNSRSQIPAVHGNGWPIAATCVLERFHKSRVLWRHDSWCGRTRAWIPWVTLIVCCSDRNTPVALQSPVQRSRL